MTRCTHGPDDQRVSLVGIRYCAACRRQDRAELLALVLPGALALESHARELAHADAQVQKGLR